MNSAIRRQARFAAGRAILPPYAAEGTWYDVRRGRRQGDDRPGMVMLDLGERRAHVPAECLEFRTAPAAPVGPAPIARYLRPVRLARSRALVAALSLVPVGAAMIIAANRFGWHRHG